MAFADGLLRRTADWHSRPVEERALRFVTDRVRQILVARRDDEVRKLLRQVRRRLRSGLGRKRWFCAGAAPGWSGSLRAAAVMASPVLRRNVRRPGRFSFSPPNRYRLFAGCRFAGQNAYRVGGDFITSPPRRSTVSDGSTRVSWRDHSRRHGNGAAISARARRPAPTTHRTRSRARCAHLVHDELFAARHLAVRISGTRTGARRRHRRGCLHCGFLRSSSLSASAATRSVRHRRRQSAKVACSVRLK